MTITRNITGEIIKGITNGLVFTDGLTIKLMVAGDSIGAGTATGQPALDYVDALATYNITATIEDASQGGKRLLGDFWDLAGATIGAEYTDEITNNANVGDVTDMVICLGTNDINLIAGAVNTKAEFKTAYQGLIDYMFADPDLAKLERVYIRPLGRHATQNSLGYQTAMESIREVHYELADENANVYMLPSYAQIDIDPADNVHPDDYTQVVQNEAPQIAYVNALASVSNIGMDITSAVVDDNGIVLTYTHENGDDLTVPSTAGDGIEAVRIFDGSTELSYNEFEKVSSNSVRLKSGSPYTGDDLKVINMYGSMYDLGHTNVPMIKDNSPYTLPARFKNISVTDSSDTILGLTDLKYYMKPSMGKTFTTGTNFDEIKSVNGGTFTALTNDFDYDSTSFGGNGGLIPTNVNAGLRGDGDLMTMTTDFMLGFVVDVQANGDIMLLGSTSYGSYGSAAFFVDGGDFQGFRFDGSPNLPTFESSVIGTKMSVIIDVQSTSVMKVYVNTAGNVTTVDPWSNFYGWSTFFLGGARGYATTSNIFGLAWGKNGAHDSGSDPSIGQIMSAMNDFKNGS